ncbi:lytic transglycosylase [Pseudomonas sp. NPDC087358]|uniref:lytic transglycosylase n=1 Tax=Pseudomonas sp. NPDC087358 TaxID=3364439 RepID=UPI00384B0F3E
MADQDWLKEYTPVGADSAQQPPAAVAATPATAATTDSNHSWLSSFTPVDQATPAPAAFTKPAAPEVGAGEAFVRGVGDGTTFGLQDEILAGLDAAVQPLISIPENGSAASTFGERYDENVANQRALLKAGQEQNPIASAAGNLAGGVIPALATGGGSASASLAGTIGKGAAVGAGYGGLYGFGSAEGDAIERLPEAATGAAIGGLLGGAVPALFAGGSALVRKAADSGAARLGLDVTEGANSSIASTPPATSGGSLASIEAGPAIVAAAQATGKRGETAVNDLSALASPDPRVLQAAEDLGLDRNLAPAQFAQNQSFLEKAQGLASVPGSPAAAEQQLTHQALARRADKLINDYGGATDKSRFSDDFRNESVDTIKQLEKGSSDLYGQVKEVIPAEARTTADNSLGYLQSKLQEVNGDTSLLSAAEQRAYRVLTADPDADKPLAAIAGLRVPERHAAAAQAAAKEADDIVSLYGGSLDKSAFSDRFKAESQRTIDALSRQAEGLYGQVGESIGNRAQAPANATIDFIQGRAADLGGKPLLSADERNALSILSPKVRTEPNPLIPGTIQTITEHPTYSALDSVRKSVGDGYKGRGPFATSSSRTLDALYANLSKDQQAVANAAGVGDAFTSAKALVAQRKGIEEGLVKTIGKDLTGSVSNVLSGAVKRLADGDYQAFDRTIANIPENLRPQAVMTAVGDAFSGGKAGGLNIPAFNSWYGALTQNAEAKARLSGLIGQEATQRLDNLSAYTQRLQGIVSGAVPDGATRQPSYEALDNLRRQVEGRIKKTNFADAENESLQRLHSSILADQQRLADAHGVGDAFQNARFLESQHREASQNLTDLIGSDLKGAISSKLGTAVAQLKNGDYKNFDTVLSKIPENLRERAVLTVLNDVFSSGSRNDASLTATGLNSFWTSLSRNQAAKERFLSYLPKQAATDVENIATVAGGMARASGARLPNGRIAATLEEFAGPDGVVSRLMGSAGKIAAAEGITSSLGLPGAGAAGVIYGIAKEKRAPLVEAAGKVLSSQQFYDAMVAYAKAGGLPKANVIAREKQLMRTQAYRKWEKNLSDASRASVRASGPLAYLTAGAD